MASCRNKNTQGDYNLQQRNYESSKEYTLYQHSQYGTAAHTQMPGNGLMPGSIPWTELSHNAPDTESFLFGIGSTNLTKPRPPPFVPQITQYCNKQANLYSNTGMASNTTLVPKPLVVPTNQRPFPM
jgi:hypothetical protein